ncbi:MAG: hypothetical protein V3V30_06285 [Parvularculaceae bacterium]
MARSLTFALGGDQFELALHKIDRAKLYGSVEREVFDAFGDPCDLATLARDGRTVIPYGGTASGYLNKDGLWVESADLTPVDVEGEKLEEVASSFNHTIDLGQEASLEDLLDHPARLAYHLTATEILPDLIKQKLAAGTIYRFGFSYRGGPKADPAFLLGAQDGSLWLLIGAHTDVSFVGYEQAAVCKAVQEKDSIETDDDDSFDFDML